MSEERLDAIEEKLTAIEKSLGVFKNDFLYKLANEKMNSLIFYNPSMAAFSLSVSMISGNIRIHLAESLDKSDRSMPQKGEQRYDHPNAMVFGLVIVECAKIVKAFDSIVNGTYINPKATDDKYKNQMTFIHPPKTITFAPIKNNSGFDTLRISIYDSEKKHNVGYILREEELLVFKQFMIQSITTFPMMQAMANGAVKLLSSAIFSMYNGDSNPNNYGSSSKSNAPVNVAPPVVYTEDNPFKDFDLSSTSLSSQPPVEQEKVSVEQQLAKINFEKPVNPPVETKTTTAEDVNFFDDFNV